MFGYSGFRSTGGKTQAQALTWLDSMVGTAIDYNGDSSVECVDLISSYYRFLGHNIFSYVTGGGHAYTFANSPLPPGWYRYGNDVSPQPGDIAVFGRNGNSPWGHIGIIRNVYNNGYTMLDYNGDLRVHGAPGTWRWRLLRSHVCLIRPDFVTPPPKPDRLPLPANGSDDNIADGEYLITSTLA